MRISTGIMVATGLALSPAPALAEPGWTVPKIPGASEAPFLVPPKNAYVDPSLRPLVVPAAPTVTAPANMRAIAKIGAQWGTVTSILRSPEHNRKVGGVVNSYHLSGRAIDIARRPGVRHADIAASLRKAGFSPIESLDEGDHSHFAFAKPGEAARAVEAVRPLVQLARVDEDGQLRLRLAFPDRRATRH